MKKLTFIFGACIALASCSKEIKESSTQNPIKKTSEYTDYEYFDVPSELEDVLTEFVHHCEEGSNPGDKEIAEGLFLLEGSLNYKYRHAYGTFETVTYEDAEYVTLELTSGGEMMSGSDLITAFGDLDVAISGITDQGDYMHALDLTVESIGESSIILKALIIKGSGLITSVETISDNANSDRRALTVNYCNNTPAPEEGCTYANRLAYYKFFLHATTSIQYKYSVNVKTYGVSGRNTMSDDNLWGGSSAAVAAHVFPRYTDDCLSTSHLNTYRDQIFTDINGLMTPDESYISSSLTITTSQQSNSIYLWIYDYVSVGEYSYTNQIPTY